MVEIIWAPLALKDIESIAEYIARDSEDQASLFILRLIKMTDNLTDFPFSGRMIPEIENKLCREIIYGSYRIMYKIVKKDIWITGIVHGARDWNPERLKND